jgi:hypothetical protein
MSKLADKIKTMWNSNGRTEAEAKAFREKAEEIARRNGLDDLVDGLIKEAAEAAKKAKAKKRSSDNAKSMGAKRKKATEETAKPVKDDGRLRKIKVVVGKDARGRNKWHLHAVVSHDEMSAAVKALRDAGHTVKTEVMK